MLKIIVLGTAQDAGVPQVGCTQPLCERARREPSFARWVACLAAIDTVANQCFLIDATPDAREANDRSGRACASASSRASSLVEDAPASPEASRS